MNEFLSLNEVSKILSIKHKMFIDILKSEGIIINTNGRNLPIPLFVSRGWFILDVVRFSVEKHNFAVQKTRITQKGLLEISKLVEKNLFVECDSDNLFKDVFMYVSHFLDLEKKNKNTIVYLNGDMNSIFLSTKTNTKLILKYRLKDCKIWLPK